VSRVVSKYKALHHYTWGAACDGWNLTDSETLSVKHERIPPGATEATHYHQSAQQFFFILIGTATFEIENSTIRVQAGEGIHIKAGERHLVRNDSDDTLEFILCSQPSTAGDRINC
jgi:mannose-6-phosphate isomerase-like protein (cupin superfamily)